MARVDGKTLRQLVRTPTDGYYFMCRAVIDLTYKDCQKKGIRPMAYKVYTDYVYFYEDVYGRPSEHALY